MPFPDKIVGPCRPFVVPYYESQQSAQLLPRCSGQRLAEREK